MYMIWNQMIKSVPNFYTSHHSIARSKVIEVQKGKWHQLRKIVNEVINYNYVI